MPATLDATQAEAALDELRRLSSRLLELVKGIEAIAQAEGIQQARERALTLSGDVPEVRVLGTLDRVTDEERSAMLAAAVKGEDARRTVNDVLDRMRATPKVHRALAHVHPYSFAPVGHEAWEQYRARLRGLRDEPMWGIPEPHRVPLGAIYVPHRYQELRPAREGLIEATARPRGAIGARASKQAEEPIEQDPAVRLRQKVAEGGLAFVVGGPGSGKSTLARIFAAELAEDPLVQPVFVRLRGVRPEAEPLSEIARVLSVGGDDKVGEALAEVFARAPKLVLLLDGFDELIQASRTGLGSFFLRLDALLRDQRLHAVVCFGRDTVFERDDTAFPEGATVLRLLPFDDGQVQGWCALWKNATGRSFDWERYQRKSTAGVVGRDEHEEALGALLHEPITLRMLALLDLEGVEVLHETGEIDLARIYRRVISEVCDRHHKERGDFSAAELRRLLRVIGYAAMQGGRELIHLDDLQRAMNALGVQVDASRSKSNATRLIIEISQRTAEGEPQAWEFLHKTLGEYLAAEYLAVEIALMVAEDEDEFGERRPRLSETQLATRWAERFGPAVIPAGVERFLRRMAGDWKAFFEEGRVREADRDLVRLSLRLGSVYRRLLGEEDAEVVVRIARAWGARPGDVHGGAMANVFLVAGLRFDQQTVFQPEVCAPGRYPEAYHVMQRSRARAAWWRICARTSFVGLAEATDLSGFNLPVTNWHGVSARRVSLRGANLAQASFAEAVFADCDLTTTELPYSKARCVVFERCLMVDADLMRANLKQVEFQECLMHGVIFHAGVRAFVSVPLPLHQLGDQIEIIAGKEGHEQFSFTIDMVDRDSPVFP